MPTANAPILTVPQRTVVLSDEFAKSDQGVNELFQQLEAVTGVSVDRVLEVYNNNLELFRTSLESLKAEEDVEVIGNTWLSLANHYQESLGRFHKLDAEAYRVSSKQIPARVFDPLAVKAVINFSIKRLERLEKRSRQLADMHGADIKG